MSVQRARSTSKCEGAALAKHYTDFLRTDIMAVESAGITQSVRYVTDSLKKKGCK